MCIYIYIYTLYNTSVEPGRLARRAAGQPVLEDSGAEVEDVGACQHSMYMYVYICIYVYIYVYVYIYIYVYIYTYTYIYIYTYTYILRIHIIIYVYIYIYTYIYHTCLSLALALSLSLYIYIYVYMYIYIYIYISFELVARPVFGVQGEDERPARVDEAQGEGGGRRRLLAGGDVREALLQVGLVQRDLVHAHADAADLGGEPRLGLVLPDDHQVHRRHRLAISTPQHEQHRFLFCCTFSFSQRGATHDARCFSIGSP